MIAVHVLFALVFGIAGAVYGLSLGLTAGAVCLLYGLCGALGMLLSICVRMAVADMSSWSQKQAQGG